MSAITFPNSPSADEQHTINGITYTFTDGTWVAVGQTNFYTLPIASSTSLGGIKGGGTDITVANDGVINFSGTLPGPKTFTFNVTGNGQTATYDPQTTQTGNIGDYTITGNDRRGIVSGTNPTIHINEEDTIIFIVTGSQDFHLVANTGYDFTNNRFWEIGSTSTSNAPTGQPTSSGTVTWVSKVGDGLPLYQGGGSWFYQDSEQDFGSNPTTYKWGNIKVYLKDTPEGKGDWLELNDTPNSYAGQAGKFTKVNTNEDGLEFTTVTGGSTTTINNNAAERVITGSATSDELNAESNLTLASNGTLTLTGSLNVDQVNINGDAVQLTGGTGDLKVRGNGTGGAHHLTLDDHVAVAGDITVKYGLKDKDSQLGTSGQVLTSTGTQVDWVDASTLSTTSTIPAFQSSWRIPL